MVRLGFRISKLTFFLRKDFDPIIYDSVAALRRVPTGCLIVRVKEGAIIDQCSQILSKVAFFIPKPYCSMTCFIQILDSSFSIHPNCDIVSFLLVQFAA